MTHQQPARMAGKSFPLRSLSVTVVFDPLESCPTELINLAKSSCICNVCMHNTSFL